MAANESQTAREAPSGGTDVSRRRMLRFVAAGAIGAVFFLALGRLDLASSARPSDESPVSTPSGTLAQPSGTGAIDDTGILRVKAVYFQMKNMTPLDYEYYQLAAPASIGNLSEVIQSRYPPFAVMRLSMVTLVDGQVATSATSLHHGDEVDFVPMIQGG